MTSGRRIMRGPYPFYVLMEPPAWVRRACGGVASELECRCGGRTGEIGEIGFEQRLDARRVDIVAQQHRFHRRRAPADDEHAAVRLQPFDEALRDRIDGAG